MKTKSPNIGYRDPGWNAPDPDQCICEQYDTSVAEDNCPIHRLQAQKYETTLEAIKTWLLRFGLVRDELAVSIAQLGYDADGYYDEERVCVYNHPRFSQVLHIDKHFVTPGWQARYWWDDSVKFDGLLELVVEYCRTHTEEYPEFYKE